MIEQEKKVCLTHKHGVDMKHNKTQSTLSKRSAWQNKGKGEGGREGRRGVGEALDLSFWVFFFVIVPELKTKS